MLPNFNMLFQLVLTTFFKSELFSCFTESWSRDQVMQRAYYLDPIFRLFRFPLPIYSSTTQNRFQQVSTASRVEQ